MRPHYKLEAWKCAMDLVEMIYVLTALFPGEEKFGLIAQMRRAAVSIPSNIAEGAARTSKAEFSNFINIAKGSLSELETQLLIAKRVGFIEKDESCFDQCIKVSGLLNGLHKYLLKAR